MGLSGDIDVASTSMVRGPWPEMSSCNQELHGVADAFASSSEEGVRALITLLDYNILVNDIGIIKYFPYILA